MLWKVGTGSTNRACHRHRSSINFPSPELEHIWTCFESRKIIFHLIGFCVVVFFNIQFLISWKHLSSHNVSPRREVRRYIGTQQRTSSASISLFYLCSHSHSFSLSLSLYLSISLCLSLSLSPLHIFFHSHKLSLSHTLITLSQSVSQYFLYLSFSKSLSFSTHNLAAEPWAGFAYPGKFEA